jgi:hypothetical protein
MRPCNRGFVRNTLVQRLGARPDAELEETILTGGHHALARLSRSRQSCWVHDLHSMAKLNPIAESLPIRGMGLFRIRLLTRRQQ